jgi:hypothetical protein
MAIFRRLNLILTVIFIRRSKMIKKLLFVLCIAVALTAQVSAYEKGDIPIELEGGLGGSWGKAEGDSSGVGIEFEVGAKAGYFFTDMIGVMGGLTLDWFHTPYSFDLGIGEADFNISAICLTLPVGVYFSPSGGFIFGGGFSLSAPFINTSSGTWKDPSHNESVSGNDVIKFKPFFNFYIDGGYDFGESSGKGIKLLLRYSKSLSDISSDVSMSKDFFHIMIGYSYITY